MMRDEQQGVGAGESSYGGVRDSKGQMGELKRSDLERLMSKKEIDRMMLDK